MTIDAQQLSEENVRMRSENLLLKEELSLLRQKLFRRTSERHKQVEEFLEERRARTEPMLEGFRGWLDKHLLSTNKKFLIGKAVGYAGSQWSKLTAYLDCVELTPDNNVSENAIRPFVIGRKKRIPAERTG